MTEETVEAVVEDKGTKLFVPAGTGPYTVESTTYNVDPTDNSITVDHHPEHVPQLLALGAKDVRPEDAPIFGARVPSEFGPSHQEHEILRGKFDALTKENETIIVELRVAKEEAEAAKDAVADLAVIRDETKVLGDTILELGLAPIENEGACDAAARLLRDQHSTIETLTAARSGTQGSEDTSESLGDATKIEDPGYTENSDYGEIVQWLKDHHAVVPGNISKANALLAIAEIVDANKGE